MTTGREKSLLYNTLACLLRGVVGMETTIELRREDYVFGKVIDTDGSMNTTMVNATYTDINGEARKFEQLYIQGKNIRYVHIPDEVNMTSTIEQQLAMISGKRDVRVKKQSIAQIKHRRQEAAPIKQKQREEELMAFLEKCGKSDETKKS